MLEVDLEYPAHLHHLHSDFPLAPEKMTILPDMLSEQTLAMFTLAGLRPAANDVKLVGHLGPRRRYVVHALLLQKYVAWGLVVSARLRGVQFRQSRWLQDYMSYLAAKRQAATTTFQSNFYKLQGNSVYGYSLKSNRHHIEVKIVRSRPELLKCTRGGRFKSATLLNQDFAIVEMKPATLKLDNPVAMGCVVLDLSKMYTYEIYFRLKDCWGPNVTLLYHDTDSFVMCVSGSKTAHQGFVELADLLDLSSFAVGHPLHSMQNYKVPLKLKVENANKVITQFYGLRSKVYAMSFGGEGGSVRKAKGVPSRSLQMQVGVEDYAACLREGFPCSVDYHYLRNGTTHTMYLWEARKVALRNLDTKRVIQEDGITTRPYFYNPVNVHQD